MLRAMHNYKNEIGNPIFKGHYPLPPMFPGPHCIALIAISYNEV